jgi:glycosyltransferase involved in cell wall biosynthesis
MPVNHSVNHSLARIAPRIGYILKRYPRYSETFVVNEILAHEAAGLPLEIFALRPPVDTHFQDLIAQVRAPVRYLLASSLKAETLWQVVSQTSELIPNIWEKLAIAAHEPAAEVCQALWLAQAVRTSHLTHLHAHFASSATTVARLASHFSGVPYSFTAHAKDIFHQAVNPEDLQRKLTDAHTVITVSDFNVHYLQQGYGQAATTVQRLYNGLDLSRFPYQSPQNRPAKIVAVGRLVEKKGFSDLIQACAILKSRNIGFVCQIIGTGELEASLREQIIDLELTDRVELVGPRPQNELKELVQSAALFAAPCLVGEDGNRDGLPTVLLEAMALGTPCVATDVTGIPEILRDGQTGVLIPQANPTALAAAMERLLSDPSLRVKLSAQARTLIEQEFDIQQNSDLMRQIFAQAHAQSHVQTAISDLASLDLVALESASLEPASLVATGYPEQSQLIGVEH